MLIDLYRMTVAVDWRMFVAAFKVGISLFFSLLLVVLLEGCVVSPVTGLVCPPGTHPGRYGRQCFANNLVVGSSAIYAPPPM